MVFLASIFLSVICGIEQFFASRQSRDWADYHQHVEYIKDRIREKWKQLPPLDSFW